MNKRIPAHIATVEKMCEDDWETDHQALVKVYKFAGSVSAMRPHNGRIYARVHHGKCVGRGRYRYQVTTVMSKKEAM